MPRVAGQKHQRAIVVFGEVGTLRVGERFQRDRVGAFDPARGFDSGALDLSQHIVLGALIIFFLITEPDGLSSLLGRLTAILFPQNTNHNPKQ